MGGQLKVDANGELIDKDDSDSDLGGKEEGYDDFDKEFGEGEDLAQLDDLDAMQED